MKRQKYNVHLEDTKKYYQLDVYRDAQNLSVSAVRGWLRVTHPELFDSKNSEYWNFSMISNLLDKVKDRRFLNLVSLEQKIEAVIKEYLPELYTKN